MTKEEIIKILNVIKFLIQSSLDEVDVDKDCKEAEEDNKQIIVALDAAIEALEAESCENAVSRDAVLDELNRLGRNAFKDDADYDSLFAFVEALQVVKLKRKVGHWIDCGEREPWYRCSECGRRVWGGANHYCPNCGLEMVEHKEVEKKKNCIKIF